MQILRKTYDWVLHWSATKYAVPALAILAFAESSFFPIPPDVLLIAMAVAVPLKAFRYAAICSVASVLGGMFGYLLGWQFMDVVGSRIVEFYHFQAQWDKIGGWYQEYNAWAVGAAGFTPLPYKVFTLAAGAFEINFPIFVLASLVSRSARFFIVAALIYRFGAPVKMFIEKYFNLLSIAFFILLALGFVAIKYLF
ncbi:MAG: DedA family protein [Nitrospinaceae bacterium]|nr:DedA family protein [Nitrospinaceae bacterium]NIR54122.1 DedA family protein [Nitrospinaceae bacterium]NIS87893.1 DedA family protein [Nitrospinaceae bacterium]NIT84762.1 DedA family protein [Nitrospinaceae bacterium]NIU46936.1 DedA family protein [Nitrospinaceae bacterium]